MKQEKGEGGGSKLGRWLGAPVRALSRACDSYVRRMSACAGRMPTHVGGRGGFAPGMPAAATLSPRSRRGGGNDDDDLSALVRAMSQREASARGVPVPVRSRSVAVGRIDEDAPCEFGPDDAVRVGRPPAVRRPAASPSAGSAPQRRAPCTADQSVDRGDLSRRRKGAGNCSNVRLTCA